MRAGRRTVHGGFVIMEAVVALAILSLFSIALLGAVTAQARTADRAATLLTARFLAEDRLTAVRLLGYDALTDLPDSLREGRFPPPFDDFTWVASSRPMDGERDLFIVEVAVSTQDRVYPLQTLVHKPSPLSGIQAAGGFVGGGQARQ